jgi:heptaprenyl diphosphate synthase
LTLLSYYLLTDPASPADDRVVRAAAAVELMHLGSLYHDDVIDHAYERRGRPSANVVWGSHMAVLGGDSVTFSGLRMLAGLGHREVSEALVAGEQMCAGMVIEAADLYVASRSEQSYLDAIDGKTASVLSLACRVGAMQAGRSEGEHEALALFGRHFGLAYQLYDDILDLTASAGEMGKPVNADLSEGIYTLPVIRAAARNPRIADLLSKAMTDEDAARARELVIASGGVDEAQAVADELVDRAAAQLAALSVDQRRPRRDDSLGPVHPRPANAAWSRGSPAVDAGPRGAQRRAPAGCRAMAQELDGRHRPRRHPRRGRLSPVDRSALEPGTDPGPSSGCGP